MEHQFSRGRVRQGVQQRFPEQRPDRLSLIGLIKDGSVDGIWTATVNLISRMLKGVFALREADDQ
eukprot:2016376-Rhodomonas_salina.1